MSAYRYCRHCDEFFELSKDQLTEGDTIHDPCGRESLDGTDGPESDYLCYEKENKY